MKKSTVYSVLCALMAFVFLFSTTMAYAEWHVQNETVNVITMASVRGKIVEVYEQNTVVYPDSTVTKIVQVQNTGTINAYPRVKIEKVWGDSRNPDGSLHVLPELSTDNILITYNTEDWIYHDGYFYYRKVLAPGETSVSLFDSFTIDEATTGNAYRNMEADIIVTLEIIQADGDSLSYWGTSYEELDVVYTETERIELTTKVDFHDPETGFTFDVNLGDLFADFKNLIPGEARSQIVEITNLWDYPVTIYFWADYIDQDHADELTKDLIYQLLHEYAMIVITDEEGNLIYEGPIWGNPDVDSTGTDSMRYPFDLGNFDSEESKRLHIGLVLKEEMDNEDLALLGLIKWVFSAQGDSPEPTESDTTTTSSEETTQSEMTASSEEIIQSETTVSSEETTQSEMIVSSEETTQSETIVSSKEITQSETTVSSEETTQSETIVSSEETTQSETTVSSEETTQSETTVSSEETTQSETTVSSDETTQSETTTSFEEETSEESSETTTSMDNDTVTTSSSSSSSNNNRSNNTSTNTKTSTNLTSSNYPTSPNTMDTSGILRYVGLAVAALLLLPITYKKSREQDDESST